MPSTIVYIGAALAEIAGCFAFRAWLRLAKSPWWLIRAARGPRSSPSC
jgi:small multidrug resistance family-3 protein